MAHRTYRDPILELTNRLSGDPVETYELASGMTDEDAELMLEVLDEQEAAEKAASIAGDLRRGGLL